METKTQIESQINFIIWVMMVDLGSSSRAGELQGGEGKREEQAQCWTFTFTFFLFFQKTFTFPTRTKLTTYILTYPTRQRFHLSTVVSEDGLRAELLFDLDAREEWETSAACKQKSRKSCSPNLGECNQPPAFPTVLNGLPVWHQCRQHWWRYTGEEHQQRSYISKDMWVISVNIILQIKY